MTIDRVTANLYTCNKCKHQWTGWNGNGNGDRNAEGLTAMPIPITRTMHLPKRCPKSQVLDGISDI
jgi:hypothetical protein